jgi:cell division protein FtsI (penicillin-binding protein 3)
VPSVYADPSRLNDPLLAANILSDKLDLPFEQTYKKLSSNKMFVWLRRHITPDLAAEIRELNLTGLGITKEPKRFYPNREVAAQVLGFSGIDAKGLEGIEKSLDDTLGGEPQVVMAVRDARGRALLPGLLDPERQSKGASVYLTLDLQVQHAAQNALRKAVEKTNAKSGLAVVLAVDSAEVLAMAVEPSFNPNKYSDAPAEHRRNRVLTDIFEPGSTLKPFSVASAMNAHKIEPSSEIFCEQGNYKIGKHTIRDTHAHGDLNISDILAKSSNIGTAKIALDLGAKHLSKDLKKLGFGVRTGVEFVGEVRGMMPAGVHWPKITTATVAFGHGIALNALQLASAYRVLASGGLYRAPRLIQRMEYADGKEPMTPRADERRVFRRSTVEALVPMLEAATSKSGTGWRAQIPGYRVAGKTGTAQKIDTVAGGYSDNKFVANFAGFVPAQNPKVVIVVVVDEPVGQHSGGQVAAPVFAEIAESTMRRLGVVPNGDSLSIAEQGFDAHETVRANIVSQRLKELSSQTQAGTVPSFGGLTLKEALVKLNVNKLTMPLEVHGGGFVVRQVPSAGSPFGHEEHLLLELAQ